MHELNLYIFTLNDPSAPHILAFTSQVNLHAQMIQNHLRIRNLFVESPMIKTSKGVKQSCLILSCWQNTDTLFVSEWAWWTSLHSHCYHFFLQTCPSRFLGNQNIGLEDFHLIFFTHGVFWAKSFQMYVQKSNVSHSFSLIQKMVITVLTTIILSL